MYVRRVSIRNIRSLVELDWEVAPGEEAGWHVILGDNGSGKSTFLRAIALALLGPLEAGMLREDWDPWITGREQLAEVRGTLAREMHDGVSNSSAPESEAVTVGYHIRRTKGWVFTSDSRHSDIHDAWAPQRQGWFSASYGPFRRFSGGRFETLPSSLRHRQRLMAHLSLFGEEYALTEALRWLQDLDYRRKDQKPEGQLLDRLISFVNDSALLPHDTRIRDVSSDGVMFEDGNGCEVPVLELSDGYRSILSLTFDLIRQMSLAYGPETVFSPDNPGKITLPGVVLIDEVDVHLHPSWQHRIGTWFLEYFPNLQFIVTTHSPIICQAAVKGSVWHLPSPGADEPARRLEGTELDRLLYGNVLDAYGTGVFGEGVTRSEAGKARIQRLAELNAKSLHQKLTLAEQKQQDELRDSTPTAGSVLNGADAGEHGR